MSIRLLSRAAVVALLALSGVSVPRAGEAHLYVAPFAFGSRLTGDARLAGDAMGTDFDLERTLGIEPRERVRGLEGFVRFLGNRIEISYVEGDYDGAERLDDVLVFNGATFNTSERVRSEVDFRRTKILYGYDFSLKIVNVGFVVGAHIVDIEARVKSSSGTTEREDLRAPIPVIGATLGIHPSSKLAIHAEASGLSLTVSNVDATLIDAYIGIDYLFGRVVGVTGGYRYFLLDATDEDEDNHVDLTQRGPFVGLVLHL